MKIWYVEFMEGCHDINCAWTNKHDAVNYFKNECLDCEWDFSIVTGVENDAESYIKYKITDPEYNAIDFAYIMPIWLDEKPYI